MKKHFVTFYSPGTFVAESDTVEIDDWNVEEAVEMSKNIVQRYNATPYGFQFHTRERNESDFDSKETARSNMYFLGGEIRTLKQVEKDRRPDEKILLSNMRSNDIKAVVVNTNSWSWTQPLGEEDIVL